MCGVEVTEQLTSVESDVRANVDKREENGDKAGECNGVCGVVELFVDLTDPVAERKTVVTSESPCLTGSGQVVGQSTGKDKNSRDSVERDNAAGTDGLGKDPDVGIARGIVECSIEVSDHEHVTDQENKTDNTVHDVGVDHSLGNGLSSVLDLLSQVSNTIRTLRLSATVSRQVRYETYRYRRKWQRSDRPSAQDRWSSTLHRL